MGEENMKLLVLAGVGEILSKIKINKIADKETKTILIKDFLNIRKVLRNAEEERQDIINKFQADWFDVLPKVAALRKENKAVDGYKDYLEAEEDTNKLLTAIFNKEAEVEITPVELDKFITAVEDEGLTLEAISFLQDNGILK